MPDPPLPDPYSREPATASSSAVAALILGILGLLCFPAVPSLIAIILGISARGEIARSHGQKSGKHLATAGVVLGVIGLVVGMAVFGLLVRALRDDGPGPTASTPARRPAGPARPRRGVAPPTAAPTASAPPAGPAPRSLERGTVITRVGDIRLVDPDGGRSLVELVGEQAAEARAGGEQLLVWVVAPDCRPCNGVATALASPELQRALGRLRLIRVDVGEHAAALRALDVPTEKIPGFALLDEHGRARDYVHGGEWDDDIPRNIAPVLGPFLRGAYPRRRDPWIRPARPDETTL